MNLVRCEISSQEPQEHEHHEIVGKIPQSETEVNSIGDKISDSPVLEMIASLGSGKSNNIKNDEYLDPSSKFDWNIELDQSKRYKLNWAYDYNRNNITFSLEIDLKRSNFQLGSDIFALGFSDRGHLRSSDFCLIWYDLAHKLHLQDAFINRKGLLRLFDGSESVCKLVNHSHWYEPRIKRRSLNDLSYDSHQEGYDNHKRVERIHVTFTRPLDACKNNKYQKSEKNDVFDASSNSIYGLEPRYIIDNGTTHLVWFSLKGPLLSLDNLDVGSLELSADLNHSIRRSNDVAMKKETNEGQRFEWGMQRVQLIASKLDRSSSSSLQDESGASMKSRSQILSEDHNNNNNNDHHQHNNNNHHLDVRMDHYEISSNETTYWCKLFKLPERFEHHRYHITKYEPLITSGNEHIVHHMELFNCANLSPNGELQLERLYHLDGGWSGECSSPKRPSSMEPCRRVIMAWAMGAKPFEYPKQVGQSIGGKGYSPFVVLEVHYNNVDRISDKVDSSGLRFHYTNRLRPFDAGILEVGLEYTPKNSIPPKLVLPMAGYCVSECTRVAMSNKTIKQQPTQVKGTNKMRKGKRNFSHLESISSSSEHERQMDDDSNGKRMRKRRGLRGRGREGEEGEEEEEEDLDVVDVNVDGGIFIFAAQMHTHLTGIASWTEQIREGKHIGELQRDNHYSPHFQEIRLLPEPRYIAPGDALIHYCLYDTRERSNITLGGFATNDEMCVTYLHYYPRIDLEICKSSVDSEALERYFAYLNSEESQETSKRLLELHSSGAKKLLNNSKGGEEEEVEKNLKSVIENYRSIEWSPRRSRELLEFYSKSPLSVQCNRSDGSRFPGFWNGIEPTKIVTRNEDYLLKSYQFSGQDLISYRGQNFKRRHAQCENVVRLASYSNEMSLTSSHAF